MHMVISKKRTRKQIKLTTKTRQLNRTALVSSKESY
jgi:hypothetical protein